MVVAEIVSQLERRGEALKGYCGVSEMRQIKHGAFGPASHTNQSEQRLDDLDGRTDDDDLLPLLREDGYGLSEVPSNTSNRLFIRAAEHASSGVANEVAGADFVFQKSPARLVSAALHLPQFSGMAGILMKTTRSELTFDYVNGVPVANQMRLRVTSRGVGRYRLDQEIITTLRYRLC